MRKGRTKPLQSALFGCRARLVPLRVIAILQPTVGIATDGLDMRPLILRDTDLCPGGRNSELPDARLQCTIANGLPALVAIQEAFAAAPAAQAKRRRIDIPQAKAAGGVSAVGGQRE